MQPKISVIVPVYKVELYLRQCIESILAQTYTNLEVILIDDGSPDKCGLICDEYAERDGRVIVLHKENGGLSSARNAGLDIATGEYIGFVDSDDWIAQDMYETLFNNLTDNEADISCCGFYQTYANTSVPYYSKEETIVLAQDEAVKQFLLKQKMAVIAWGKLYKNSIFENIRYPLGKIYEDNFIILDILSQINKAVVNTVPKYYYRKRKSGIMSQLDISKKLHAIEAYEYNLKVVEKRFPAMVEIAFANLLKVNSSVLGSIIMCKNHKKMPEYKTILALLQKNFIYIMKSGLFERKYKFKAVALQINVLMLKLIIILNLKLKKDQSNIFFE